MDDRQQLQKQLEEMSKAAEEVRDKLRSVSEQLSTIDSRLLEQDRSVGSSLQQLAQEVRVIRGRLSDLDSRQRTSQLVGRFIPPPYVTDLAHTGAAFRERDGDRSPASPYAQ